ncbi:MAG TPA: hypothetical protein VN577_03680 [Terriglobales bacterium]|nr:hypothetical protein [Terriglobales bacterium]
MAVVWNDERMTPERLIQLLEQEHRHWLETALAFERLKTYLTGTFSLQDADDNVRQCKQRAQALEETIRQLREEYGTSQSGPGQFTTMLMIQ